jgi:hypothetical protein
MIWFIRPDYSTIATAELMRGCTGGDAAAWQEFIRRFHTIIAITVSRAARRWTVASPQIVDDLVKKTYLTLCADHGQVLRQLRFEHGDAISLLKRVTVSVVDDHFRALSADRRGGNTVSTPRYGSETNSDTDRPALSGRYRADGNK